MTELKITKTPLAERDIIDNYVYIAKDNPKAADNFCDAIYETLMQISITPLIGVSHVSGNSKLQNIRIFPVSNYRNYLIFYIPTDDEIKVIRIIRRERDLSKLI